MADLVTPFLEAAAAGTLLVQRCSACDHAQLPPRRVCACCGSQSLDWTPASGGARLESYAVLHRAPTDAHRALIPYVYALVALDEGPRIVTNVVDAGSAELRIGRRLRVRFPAFDGDEQPWPVFAPAD
jgi:uncharacterized OB-fold protein